MKYSSFFLTLLITSFLRNNLQAQCMMYPVSLQSRSEHAALIVEGKVLSQKSLWDASQTMIYTATQVEVYKVFKGNAAVTGITIITEGGRVGNSMVVVNPGVQFQVNDAGIFFINTAKAAFGALLPGENIFELQAAAQGFIRYDVSDGTAHAPFDSYDHIVTQLYPLVLQYAGSASYTELKPVDFMKMEKKKNSLTTPAISSFSPSSTFAGTLSSNLFTITGSNFGASYVSGTSKVEFKNANDGGSTYITVPDNHIQSWSSTGITLWVPTGAGTGKIKVTNDLGETGTSSTSITISYNETNVIYSGTYYKPDLVNDNSAGGYTFVYNTDFNSNADAVAAFERAMQTWRCNTYVNFTRSGTTSIAANASDGVNVVTFDGSSPLSTGILGTSYSYYTSCASGVWYLSESDLKFRTNGTDGISWNFGPGSTTSGYTDFESVCLHELGHSHQLGHTNNGPVTVMHYAIGTATDRRTLTTSSEIDGGNDIISRSIVTNSCGPTALTTLTSGTCAFGAAPVADFTASATSICKNGKVNFTDLSTNSPTSWLWSFSGATPSSSTLQNPTGIKYTTPGTYSVTLTATNGIGSDDEVKTSYITVNALPTATVTAGGPTTFCDGGSVLLSANTGVGLSYQWKNGSANISGATASTYTASATGTFKVVVTNSSGCSQTSGSISVTENPKPAATITPGGPTTFCPGDSVILTANSGVGLTYQWKKGSTNISGATKISYTAKTTATYKVAVTSAAGCSKTSTGVSVTAVCKTDDYLSSEKFFRLYPNPSASSFTIDQNGMDESPLIVTVYDVTGRMMQQHALSQIGNTLIAGGDLLPGIYFIKVSAGEQHTIVKWIKTNQ